MESEIGDHQYNVTKKNRKMEVSEKRLTSNPQCGSYSLKSVYIFLKSSTNRTCANENEVATHTIQGIRRTKCPSVKSTCPGLGSGIETFPSSGYSLEG